MAEPTALVPLPEDARRLLSAANYVHLSTLRADGTPRNWVVWVDIEGDYVLVCTGRGALKAKDMLANPAVGLSVTAGDNPYDMVALQGRVVEVRDDEDCGYMDRISHKYTSQPFPMRGPGRVCFVIGVAKGAGRQLSFTHQPGES